MRKINLIVSLLIVAVFSAIGQNNTTSPYSRYGLGELINRGFGQSRAMGGLAVGLFDPGQINIVNPASYSSFEKRSFIFEFGLKSKASIFKTNDQSYTDNSSNIDYFVMGFPVIHSKWHSTMGLVPFSFVGYNLEMTEETTVGTASHIYTGSGGLQQFYIGNSFLFLKHLSLGVNASYLFGDISYTKKVSFPGSSYVYNFYNEQSTVLGDLFFNFGAAYTDTILNKNDSAISRDLARKIKFNIGFTYDNASKINGSSSIFTTTSLGTGSSLDTLQNENINNGFIDIPQNIGLGLSFTFMNGIFNNNSSRFTIAADYRMQNWEDARFFGRNDSLLNNKILSMGIEYVPNYYPRKNVGYFQRVFYRLGFHTNTGYVQINNEAIKDFGISFGLGLPLNKYTKSTMNISFEFGKTGTLANNLLQENYGIVSLSLSLHDRWFNKRKFD